MTLYTRSTGILTNSPMLQACLEQPLARYSPLRRLRENDGLLGWGNNADNAGLARKAAAKGVPFIRLEDGFIGYIGHPATGGRSLSVVVDDEGIYYDSSKPSSLESLIAQPLCANETARAQALQKTLVDSGATKYNGYANPSAHLLLPEVLDDLLAGGPYVLLIDQIADTPSLAGADVSESDVVKMIADARDKYPDARLLIRPHPDTLQDNKKGLLSSLKDTPQLADAIWFAQPCHPHALIRGAEAVFTLSSQLGFEALILGKPVHCYGLPFYAGWGLTKDDKLCPRRQSFAPRGVSLAQLLYAALVRYARYYNPVLERRCEVEEAIEVVRAQQLGEPRWKKLYLLGFSKWKRAFMGDFCRHLTKEIEFISKPPYKLERDEKLLMWGNSHAHMHQVLRADDGFIRSAGLGSNFCRPSSLVIDSQSIYYNARRPNNLRLLLNTLDLTTDEIARGENLHRMLVEADINKYNLSQSAEYLPANGAAGKQKLLVVGQVNGGGSTVTGSPVIQNNEQLLWAVRKAYPDAWIIYKPHPDVVAGNRKGQLSAECHQQCVDEQVGHLTLTNLYPQVDELHTMTSLSGFEALLRGKKVVTWGHPFYAGWGLTEDKHPTNGRLRPRSLAELLFITLVKYPIYIDWDCGLYSTPEWMTEKFATRKAAANQQQSRWRRWLLKLSYLKELRK